MAAQEARLGAASAAGAAARGAAQALGAWVAGGTVPMFRGVGAIPAKKISGRRGDESKSE